MRKAERPAGLGLAIVKEIVDAHHGTIRINDNPAGHGLIFNLSFPLWAEPASTPSL